ncbi:MAG: hydrogenase 4 subunit F [Verrucomicrobiota bacterium]
MLLMLLVLVPLLAGLLCWRLREPAALERVNLLAFAVNAALAVWVGAKVLAQDTVEAFGGFLRVDSLSALVVGLNAFVALACGLYAVGYLRQEQRLGKINAALLRRYYVLTPVFVGTMMAVPLLNNLGLLWVAIESTTLASVLLVRFYNQKSSLEAAWKYIIIGSAGIALALFGTVLVYSSAVQVVGLEAGNGFNWSVLRGVADQCQKAPMRLGFILVLVGYGTKAGLAPMHTWLPDAHSEAPSPTSAMLSGVSLKVALYALLRFHILTSACLGSDLSCNLLLGFGLFSMLLAGPFILMQKNLKRMLAYSSLEHVGLICAAVGMNAPLTVFGALLHMGCHALTKPVLFFAAGNIHQHFHTLDFRRIGSGLARSMPATALLLGFAAVAVCGLPPFGLFISELTVVAGGFTSQQAWVSIVILVSLIVVFCGMLNKLSGLLLGPAPAGATREPISLTTLAAMALPLAALLVLTVRLPDSLWQLMNQAAGIIRGSP